MERGAVGRQASAPAPSHDTHARLGPPPGASVGRAVRVGCEARRGSHHPALPARGLAAYAARAPGCRVQVIATARTCSLILIVLDCLKPITHKKLIEHELEGA